MRKQWGDNYKIRAIILEIKAVKSFGGMEKGRDTALQQIEERGYYRGLMPGGYSYIWALLFPRGMLSGDGKVKY